MCSVLDPKWVRRLRLDNALMQQLSELPGTKHLLDLHDRALVLSQWRACPTHCCFSKTVACTPVCTLLHQQIEEVYELP